MIPVIHHALRDHPTFFDQDAERRLTDPEGAVEIARTVAQQQDVGRVLKKQLILIMDRARFFGHQAVLIMPHARR